MGVLLYLRRTVTVLDSPAKRDRWCPNTKKSRALFRNAFCILKDRDGQPGIAPAVPTQSFGGEGQELKQGEKVQATLALGTHTK